MLRHIWCTCQPWTLLSFPETLTDQVAVSNQASLCLPQISACSMQMAKAVAITLSFTMALWKPVCDILETTPMFFRVYHKKHGDHIPDVAASGAEEGLTLNFLFTTPQPTNPTHSAF